MLCSNTSIDSEYPESYSDSQLSIGDMIISFMESNGSKYNKDETSAILDFIYELTGIKIEHDWATVDGWFMATSDMAYDEYSKRYCEEQ